ncbi:hypothetical protein PanWU01x14_330710 [Parasponia andersonii]|uniref:Uncharacterized protein n=1 Tax=Parasponia andersonii TaxID=3476 RepID=A0A2P5AHV9_PARAD|nr:hypothetical protein PanWU01x14_330710 [Parasponia andersonii]
MSSLVPSVYGFKNCMGHVREGTVTASLPVDSREDTQSAVMTWRRLIEYKSRLHLCVGEGVEGQSVLELCVHIEEALANFHYLEERTKLVTTLASLL